MIYAFSYFFVQKSFLTKKIIFTEISLTTWGPLNTCLVYVCNTHVCMHLFRYVYIHEYSSIQKSNYNILQSWVMLSVTTRNISKFLCNFLFQQHFSLHAHFNRAKRVIRLQESDLEQQPKAPHKTLQNGKPQALRCRFAEECDGASSDHSFQISDCDFEQLGIIDELAPLFAEEYSKSFASGPR